MRTQVGIVGAGPAGLFLAHLLQWEGIDSIVIDSSPRAYIEGRVRAGVLEHPVAELLVEAGAGERLQREGLVHNGIVLRFEGASHRLNFADLADGHSVVIYGQHEITKDLITSRLAAGGDIRFEVSEVSLRDIESRRPMIYFKQGGRSEEIECDIIAGCDGFYGACRAAIPAGVLDVYERIYPYSWIGILADAPPAADELIYASHQSGFALASMRSQNMARLYFQVAPDEDLSDWSDDRIWDELDQRLIGLDSIGWLLEGPVLQKGLTALRSYVGEPMRYGRLFLAGDAAHILPPTGAKGMNLALADAAVLARTLAAFFKNGDNAALDRYSDICLRRVWQAQRFSWWITQVFHRAPRDTPFDLRRQIAELRYTVSSTAAATTFAESYVGRPIEMP